MGPDERRNISLDEVVSLSVGGVLDVDLLYRERAARLLLGLKGVGPTECLA